jgi:DNA-binding transcriptional MerR regulator
LAIYGEDIVKNSIYEKDELLKKVAINNTDLNNWERLKLVSPVGYSDEKVPLYSGDMVEKIIHIKKLLDFGYELNEIQKIIKKIGLPAKVNENIKQNDKQNYVTVGKLAEQIGVSPRTIKHWEDKGIIEPDMRSEGGFRLYSRNFVFLCELIKDLQLFGYSLEEIKVVSDLFRDYLTICEHLDDYSCEEVSQKIDLMSTEIKALFEKINLLKEGIQRWDDLLKKKKKEIATLQSRNKKRLKSEEKSDDE